MKTWRIIGTAVLGISALAGFVTICFGIGTGMAATGVLFPEANNLERTVCGGVVLAVTVSWVALSVAVGLWLGVDNMVLAAHKKLWGE